MDKGADINIEAYRLVAESLLCLRAMARRVLAAEHGEGWAETGIPTDVLGFLLERQSREAAISWLPADGADLLDFAGFSDLDAVITATPPLQAALAPLAPPAILHARLLELQTMLNRVAYVRPIAESEMALLATFFDRLRRLSSHVAGGPTKGAEAVAPSPGPETAAEAGQPASAEATPAYEAMDDRRVLEALYREITTLAEGLWGQGSPGGAPVWEQLQASGWFDEAVFRLDLQPVGDFYAIVEQARARLDGGASRADLQEFLKQAAFAQVLMSLRQLFSGQMAAPGQR